jgi:hypothetical protein
VQSSSHGAAIAFHAGGALAASVVAADNSLLLCLAPRNEVAGERSAAGLVRRWRLAACVRLLVRSSLGASYDVQGGVMSELLLDAAGRRRSPATLPQFHAGRRPRNKTRARRSG